MKPIDLSNMRVVDLSQNWDVNTPSFATYEGPTVKWIKRPALKKWEGSSSHPHCMSGRTWMLRCTLSLMGKTLEVFR